jgi:hypothetical protein
VIETARLVLRVPDEGDADAWTAKGLRHVAPYDPLYNLGAAALGERARITDA